MQKIMVCLKRVVDYNVRIRVKPDGSGVATDGVKMSINPFDEIALEEALRIKEAGNADEVIAVSIGSSDAQQQLRTGLAMGADRAILVEATSEIEPLSAARIFLALIATEQPTLVILGKQAIDDDCNQTGQMLAALWDRHQATFASEVTLDEGKARVTREVDAGLEVIEVDLPAVVTTDLSLNEPRYVKLPDIMKAKKKPLDVISAADMGVDMAPQFKAVNTEPPRAAAEGRHGQRCGGTGRGTQSKGTGLMARVLIVAEHDGSVLNPATAKCVTCATSFASDGVDVGVFGTAADSVADAAAGIAGVARVIRVCAAQAWAPVAALLAPQVAELAAGYSHVFGPSTTFGKDLMPRVAALLGVGQLSDVMAADSAYQFKRPIYAGDASHRQCAWRTQPWSPRSAPPPTRRRRWR